MKRLALLFTILVLGSGCHETPTPLAEPITKPATVTPASWHLVAPHVARIDFDSKNSPHTTFIIYRIEKNLFTWHFSHDETGLGKSVSDWKALFPNALLISNGVYFNSDSTPTGLFVSTKKRVGMRSFDDAKSALVVLNPNPHIIDTRREAYTLEKLSEAAQSYPLLIIDGKSLVQKDSGQIARRTFIGTDTIGNTYLGIVSAPGITLAKLSKTLEEMHTVSWDRVLNLDGGPSSGIISSFETQSETIDSIVAVPNVIVMEPKTSL